MKGLIVGSGTMPDSASLQKEKSLANITVCADGGAAHFLRAGVFPDILLGDMDSISPSALRRMEEEGVEILRYPSEKNETDMELAVRLLIDKGIRDIRMLGGTGTRMDHTATNLCLVSYLWEQGIRLTVVDGHNEITALSTGTVRKKGEFLSILPLDETVIVSIRGVKYPLQAHKIRRGTSLGISNVIISEEAEVEVHAGRGLLVQAKE